MSTPYLIVEGLNISCEASVSPVEQIRCVLFVFEFAVHSQPWRIPPVKYVDFGC